MLNAVKKINFISFFTRFNILLIVFFSFSFYLVKLALFNNVSSLNAVSDPLCFTEQGSSSLSDFFYREHGTVNRYKVFGSTVVCTGVVVFILFMGGGEDCGSRLLATEEVFNNHLAKGDLWHRPQAPISTDKDSFGLYELFYDEKREYFIFRDLDKHFPTLTPTALVVVNNVPLLL